MLTALDVANTFLSQGKAENVQITPMQLQKFVYIFYKEYLRTYEQKLFAEPFETWRYGPVLRTVYDSFKFYGSNPISDYYYLNDGNYQTMNLSVNPSVRDLFFSTWYKYKQFDGITLSEMTHRPNTAWSKAQESGSPFLMDQDIFMEEPYIV